MKRWMALAAATALAACQQPTEEAARPETGNTEAMPPAASAVSNKASQPTQASARSSQFTPLDPAVCRLIEESDEGPYWRRRCDGVGGYAVEWTESDLRQNLMVISPSGAKTSLDLPSKVANGAFDRLGSRIEWRGPAGGPPDVLVVRVHVANDQGEDDGGHLAIARLSPTQCLIAVVRPQAGQSAEARRIADAKPGACRAATQ